MNVTELIVKRKHHLLCMRYHEEKAKSIARMSGFSSVYYTCEYYADRILQEKQLVRRYRARVLLCDRAMKMIDPEEAKLLRERFERRRTVNDLTQESGVSRRTFFRRQARALEDFRKAVAHLIRMRQKMKS